MKKPLSGRCLPFVIAVALLLALGFPTASDVAAQQRQSTKDDRPYDTQILRLSEVLGAIHYLRELCGAEEGQLWRKQMRDLLKVEGTTAIRRAKLVKGFNKGYRGFRRTYRDCNDSAKLAVNRFLEEGAEITDLLVKQNR